MFSFIIICIDYIGICISYSSLVNTETTAKKHTGYILLDFAEKCNLFFYSIIASHLPISYDPASPP